MEEPTTVNITFQLTTMADESPIEISRSSEQSMQPSLCEAEIGETTHVPSIYRHAPLDPEKQEIRLLQASKRVEGGREALFTCMKTVSLLDSSRPPYKALSYVWHDDTPVYDPKAIEKSELGPHHGDEITSTSIEKLRGSALAAIWQLMNTEKELTIWIDGICIDQENIAERGSQVSIMSIIYQNAEEVVAWLGPDSAVYGIGFETIDRMASFGEQYYEERWFQWCYRSDVPAEERRSDQYYEGPDGERIPAWNKTIEAAEVSLPEWFVQDEPNGNPPPKIFELVLMGLSTFFSRAWIFQELAFSRKSRIMSGSVSTTLSNLIMATKVSHTLLAAAEYSAIFGSGERENSHWNPGEYSSTPFNRPMVRRMRLWDMTTALLRVRDVHRPAVPMPILSHRLLLSFSDFNATDPRDKIFALWGFVKNGAHTDLLRPDYSLTVEEVYSRATKYMIIAHRELTMLKTHDHGESTYETFVRLTYQKSVVGKDILALPSWVPDFRKMSLSNDTTSQAHIWLAEKHKGRKPTFDKEEFDRLVKFSNDSRTVSIRGMKVGVISTTYGGNIFPYPVKSSDGKGSEEPNFQRGFINFLRMASQGKEILSQYFRFVFRSAEGTTNELLDYRTDLGEAIHTMKFFEDGKGSVDQEGVFGSRIVRFLAKLVGENDIFTLQESDGGNSATIRDSLGVNTTSPDWFSQWWEALTGAFDIGTWPDKMRDGIKAAAYSSDMSGKIREESMDEIEAWIGKKTFNFFIVPGFGLGVCPDCVSPEKDDFVFRPAAHDGPIVLRPAGDGTYKNVGECFISHSLVRSMDREETMRSMMPLYQWINIV